VSIQDGEWLFRFRNHEDDRNPSTMALGDHRRLQLNGQHGFEQRQFFLPDQMSAQELGNHLAERLGWQPLDEDPPTDPNAVGEAYRFHRADQSFQQIWNATAVLPVPVAIVSKRRRSPFSTRPE
jgi:hypothetical protein